MPAACSWSQSVGADVISPDVIESVPSFPSVEPFPRAR